MPPFAQQRFALLSEDDALVGIHLTDAPQQAGYRLLEPSEARRNPLIRKLEGFGVLSEADRAILAQISANPRLIGPRIDLIREGDRPEGVFLILDGMACRHKVRQTGARQILAYLLPGDLGDHDVALLDTMDHTISTVSACRVVHVSPEIIAHLTQHHPQVARALRMSTLVDEANPARVVGERRLPLSRGTARPSVLRASRPAARGRPDRGRQLRPICDSGGVGRRNRALERPREPLPAGTQAPGAD